MLAPVMDGQAAAVLPPVGDHGASAPGDAPPPSLKPVTANTAAAMGFAGPAPPPPRGV